MASQTVIDRLKAGGILSPKMVVAEAARAGLRLEVAAALLEKESAGGHNVFGHDRDRNHVYIFPARDGTVKVTKELYLEYKRKRIASNNKLMQGVGPCQLTWWEFQDDADAEGGCWRPQINMRIGFRRMASLMKAHGDSLGAERYNGSGPNAVKYSKDLLERVAAWKARLGDAAPVHVPEADDDGPLRLGSRGPKVVRLTRRLARARSKAGTPYLAKPRREVDAVVEAALKTFQAEHRLEADGVYGPVSQRKLNRVLRLQAKPPVPVPAPADKPPVAPRPALKALVADVQRYDAETGEAWDKLVAHAARRRKLLRQAKATSPVAAEAKLNAAVSQGFASVTALLKEIDGSLDTLVAERDGAVEVAAVVEVPAPVALGEATVTQAMPPAPPAPEGPAPPSPAAPPPPSRRRLTDLTDAELLERIEKLDRALDRSRAVLIGRFAATEKELHKLAPPKRGTVPKAKPKPQVVVKPVPKRPPEPSRTDVKALQTALNAFTEKRLELAPLIVDGVRGVATKRRIRAAKFYLGYSRANAKSAVVDDAFLRRLKHPRSARHSSPAMLTRAVKRRRTQRKGARLSSGPAAGVTTFDGKPVAAWLKPYLVWARNNGWQGQLNSGWRDPAYSEQLCRNMCGAPSCPGKCAGRTSNHAGSVKPAGAVDVSDYGKFGELMKRCPLEPRIFNALGARDPVHFSASGR